MLIRYPNTPLLGIAGMTRGTDRATRGRQLALLAQVERLTVVAGAATDDLVVTITDDDTAQAYVVTATGDADESVLGANLLAALAVSEADKIFSAAAITATSGSNLIVDFTARHPNRTYTFAVTGGTGAPSTATSVAAGGTGLAFGKFVARGATDGTFAAVGAATTVADLLGMVERTEANHFHSLDNDTATAVDLSQAGVHLPILYRGEMLVAVEDAVTPASTPYMRRGLTASVGTLGALRATVAGVAQVSTVAPTVNHGHYAFEFGYLGKAYSFSYQPTTVTTAVADAIDGLYDAILEVLTDAGLEAIIVPTESDTLLTFTTVAGHALDYLRPTNWALDAEATAGVCVLGTIDVDTIDISSIAEFQSTAAAGGLAWLRLKM